MSSRININYIDWEKFHRRFEGVDWPGLDEETAEKLAYELLWGQPERQDFNRNAGEECSEALAELKALISNFAFIEKFKSPLWRKFFWWMVGAHSSREAIYLFTANNPTFFEDLQLWIKNAEWVFRLMPLFAEHESEIYRDSPLDLSYFRNDGIEVYMVSSTSLRTIAGRIPPPLLETFPQLRSRSEGGQSDKDFGDIDYYLYLWQNILERAEKSDKGLCIFIA